MLSTIESAPADLASDETRAMSMMRRFGFAGVSKSVSLSLSSASSRLGQRVGIGEIGRPNSDAETGQPLAAIEKGEGVAAEDAGRWLRRCSHC